MSLYSRETEPQIWEHSLNSEISQKIVQFFSLLHSPYIEVLSNLRFGSLEIRDTSVIVRYLRNLSVSLLEGIRTSDLREFSKFRDFSEIVPFFSLLHSPRYNKSLLLGYRKPRHESFYLRAAISDCLLIRFIRATETLRKNWNKQNSILELMIIAQNNILRILKRSMIDQGHLNRDAERDDTTRRTPWCGQAASRVTRCESCQTWEERCEDLKFLRCLLRPSLSYEKHRSFLFSRLELLNRTDPDEVVRNVEYMM